MKRNEFFSTFGVTAGMLFLAPAINSCSKSDSVASTDNTNGSNTSGTSGTGGTIDFTLDLSTSTYSALNNNGGSIVKNGVIIAKTSSGAYVALASACTHEGTTLGFDSAGNRFHCPNHGSNFGLDGALQNGPATSALKKYNTQLTGTMLRIFA